MYRHLRNGLLLLFLIAACSQTDDPTPNFVPSAAPQAQTMPVGLRIALIDNQVLYLVGADTEILAEGEITSIHIAPDGETIAFTRGSSGLSETLWLVNADGTDQRQIDAPPIISQVAWQEGDTLYVNTAERDTVGLSPRDDLYRVDVNTNEVTEIEPGGNVSISSDETAVIITPGMVSQSPEEEGIKGTIHVLLPDGAQTPLYTFEAVATASHRRFYPTIQWVDNVHFFTAIPPSQMIYDELNESAAPIDWVRIPINGIPKIAQIDASFFGLPVRSPLNGDILYLRREANSNQFTIMIADEDGSNAEAIQTADAGDLLMPQWVDERFIYVYDGAYWIGRRGAESSRWIELNPDFITQPHIVGGTDYIVYQDVVGGNFQLRYAQLGSDTSTLIYESDAFIQFDAVFR